MYLSCIRGGSDEILEKNFNERIIRHWNELPGKMSESPSPEAQDVSVCGTWEYDLGVLLGGQLDKIILKVSSSLD